MFTDYTLTRSKRKTISLQVRRDLTVAVRAPMRTPRAQIDLFVQQHEDWIRKHRKRMAETAVARAVFTYADGERIPCRGRSLILTAGDGGRTVADEFRLYLPPGADRPEAVKEFLRETARQLAHRRITHFAPLLGVAPTGVKITSAATRWGSCSGRDSLCFSFRVACLPDRLLDYIVVHELSHIREHNHSDRFWAVVATVLPDYAACRAELRQFQGQIPF